MKSLLFLGFLLAYPIPSLAQVAYRWDLNDVSILFPLPKEGEDAGILLGPGAKGPQGELLPHGAFARIPTLLNNGNGNATLFKGALRVVSARLDPCPDEILCQPELRLIWQPIERDEDTGRWTSRDGSLHTFYALSPGQFSQLKSSLWKLKSQAYALGIETEGKPLGVHPAFLEPATSLWFRNQMEAAILAVCGDENLKKITFMSLLVPSTWWRFGAFEKGAAGKWEVASIPRLAMNFQDVFNSAMEEGGVSVPGKEMDAIFNVLPETYPDEDNLHALINRGFRFNDSRDLPVFQKKLDAVARFQNPHRTSPRTLDCASCHYADAAAFFSGLRFSELRSYFSPDRFQSPDSRMNLRNETVGAQATRILRAFGYFGEQPALMQRVIHDSAVSANWLNK